MIFGDYTPSGRLSVAFPNASGQSTLCYNHFKTGKPATEFRITSHYQETSHLPLFPFGYGLSYTEYEYKDLAVKIDSNRLVTSVTVKNTGKAAGAETVQLYVQDIVGSIVRPVRELKGYKRVELLPGEEKRVEIVLEKSELGFYNHNMNYAVEPGEFKVWMGHDSTAMLCCEITL